MQGRILHGSILFLILLAICTACSSRMSPPQSERKIKNNVYLEDVNIGGLTEPEAKKRILEHAARIEAEPRDATLDEGTWEVGREEKAGRKVNVEATLQALKNAQEGNKVNLVVDNTPPQVTSKVLNGKI